MEALGHDPRNEPAPDVPHFPLDREAVVIRAGVAKFDALKSRGDLAMRDNEWHGRSVFSVWSFPGLTAEEIAVEVARFRTEEDLLLPHGKLQPTTLGKLLDCGFEYAVRGDFPGHLVLILPDPPADTDYAKLLGALADPTPNPVVIRNR